MSQNQQIPPMVQELLAKFQQTQQNLQMILAQKQQLELEKLETEKALEELKNASDDLLPFLLTIPLQKLAYYTALEKGYDIDKPRNLAKSVTVE